MGIVVVFVLQDSYQEPTMLQCKHIFCEDCVSTWFDRDTTCPMCRAKVFFLYVASREKGGLCRERTGSYSAPLFAGDGGVGCASFSYIV